VTELLSALSTAQPLPPGLIALAIIALLVSKVIRHGPDWLRAIADIIRAMNGK
jgi:hypothetical protein